MTERKKTFPLARRYSSPLPPEYYSRELATLLSSSEEEEEESDAGNGSQSAGLQLASSGKERKAALIPAYAELFRERRFSAASLASMPMLASSPCQLLPIALVSLPSVAHSFPSLPKKCTNCNALETPTWRKDVAGNRLCNACGLFSRLHHGAARAAPVAAKRQRKGSASQKPQQHAFQIYTRCFTLTNDSFGS